METSLVLSGGGTRGFYHIGVVAALQERKAELTDITGTSVGALIGAIAAANPGKDIRALLAGVKVTALIELSITRRHMFGTKKLEKLLRTLIPVERFEDLAIPLKVIATDINTGEEIVLSRGPLFPALLASCAVPGVFPIVEHERKLLADGGIVNNAPLSHARGPRVVVSDVTFPLQKIDAASPAHAVLLNAFFILMRNTMRRDTDKDVLFVEPATITTPADVRQAHLMKLIEQGYADAKKALGKW